MKPHLPPFNRQQILHCIRRGIPGSGADLLTRFIRPEITAVVFDPDAPFVAGASFGSVDPESLFAIFVEVDHPVGDRVAAGSQSFTEGTDETHRQVFDLLKFLSAR